MTEVTSPEHPANTSAPPQPEETAPSDTRISTRPTHQPGPTRPPGLDPSDAGPSAGGVGRAPVVARSAIGKESGDPHDGVTDTVSQGAGASRTPRLGPDGTRPWSSLQNTHPDGGAGQDASGTHSVSGCHPDGGEGHPGGAWNSTDMPIPLPHAATDRQPLGSSYTRSVRRYRAFHPTIGRKGDRPRTNHPQVHPLPIRRLAEEHGRPSKHSVEATSSEAATVERHWGSPHDDRRQRSSRCYRRLTSGRPQRRACTRVDNGLLRRSDVHTLFDAGYPGVHPRSGPSLPSRTAFRCRAFAADPRERRLRAAHG